MATTDRLTTSSTVMLMMILVLVIRPIFVASTVPHLKVRRILLPYNLQVPTNYTLEIEHSDGACFKWESTRTDVATVTAIFDEDSDIECSTRALVTAVSRSRKRQSSVIYAKESNGGPVLTADVEVDAVDSIDIITRTREIAMDAYPEEFQVIARNDQNNTFSALDGIEFEWDLKQVAIGSTTGVGSRGDDDSVSILRFRKASEVNKDSNYWEERDRRGFTVQIEGVKTGTSRVIVKIKDAAYAKVKSAEIQLIVHARIDLRPADPKHLLPFGQISYSVTILKNTQVKPLPLPSEQYYLQVTDAKIASLDLATSTLTALKEGSTTIVLRDRNIKSAGIDLKPTSAEVTVAKPSYLVFYMEPGTPGKEWSLQHQTFYTLTVEIFDGNHNKMYASPNLALSVIFPIEYFKVIESTSNGTYHYIQAIKQGDTKVRAILAGARKADGSIGSNFKSISLDQDVNIYPKLQVMPRSIFLPWDNIVKPTYAIQLAATGATGVYRWDSSQPTVATILHSARETANPKLVAKALGFSKITVRDANNQVFVQQVPVEVSDVIDIDIMPGIVETQLESSVYVNVALYGRSKDDPNTRKLFDNCTEIPLNVEIVEKSRFSFVDDKTPAIHPKACRALELSCIGVGPSRITVSYETPDGPISTTTIVSCFMPLKIVHPNPAEKHVLALGTSVEVAFEGGPRKWPNHGDRDYFADLSPEMPGIFDVKEVIDAHRARKDLHIYRVTCKSIGEAVFNMRVGNKISPTLPNPAIIQETITLVCSVPVDLVISPKMRKDENCPKSFHGRKYPVSLRNPIEIELTAWDIEKRKFLNVSSLSVAWSLSDNSLGKMRSSKNFNEEVNGSGGFRKWNRNYQIIVPTQKEGDLIVSVSVATYRSDVLKAHQINNFKDPSPIRTDVSLLLVEKPAIEPSSMTLFNHPKNQALLKVIRGSGHFKLDSSESDAKTANITFDELSTYITVKPKADGRVAVKVIDCCVVHELGSSLPDAQANVRIVDPHEIKVIVKNKIQLGTESEVQVQVIGTSGEVIESNFHPLMNLHPVLSNDIATISETPSTDKKVSVYKIKAEKLGTTGLTFRTGSTTSHIYKKVVTSLETKIQVFPPLSISSQDLKLVVGATFEVSVSGGPPESSLEFSTPDSNVVIVSSSGLLRAVTIGSTILTVRSVEKDVIHSTDRINVEVLPLLSIRITCPLKKLVSGSVINPMIVAFGPKNERLDPFAFGSVNPKLKISWTISNPDVLQLLSSDSQLGVTEDSLNMFAVRVVGKNDGTSVLRASVEVLEEADDSNKFQIFSNRILSDNVTLSVASDLRVLTKVPGVFLLSPGSALNFKSSRDGVDKITYEILNGQNNLLIDKGRFLKSSTNDPRSAVLLVKSVSPQGLTQVATFGISIEPISYIVLVPQKPLTTPKYLNSLENVPVGTVFRVDVNFYDILGRKFDVVNVVPEIRLNRNGVIAYKLVSVDNQLSLELTASREGSTIVRIWLPGTDISDYMKIVVGELPPPPPPVEEVTESPVPIVAVPGRIVFEESPPVEPKTSFEIAVDICLAPIRFFIDQFPFLVSVLVVGTSGAVVFNQYLNQRPVPVDPNFANYQPPPPGYHQPSFPSHHSPGPGVRTATVNPFAPASPFGSRSTVASPLTQRRIATSDTTCESGAFNASGNLFTDSQLSGSPSRPSTSPKGIVGRPLWSSPRS